MRILGILFLLLAPKIEATTAVYSTLAECEREPRQCISYTNAALVGVEPQSVHWYHLKNLNLAAYWQLSLVDELLEEMPALAALEDAPAVFRVTVLTIYSKLLISAGDLVQGEQMADEATRLIRQVNAVSLNPDRYAELIVLLNYLEKYDEAEAAGIELLARLERTRRPADLGDLYTAVGHTEFYQKKFAAAKGFYTAALEGYMQTQHILEISNTLHNIARCHQEMQQFEQAIAFFEQALGWKTRDSSNRDHKNEQYTRMRLAESLFKAGYREQAEQAFAMIDSDHVLKEYQGFFDSISELLAQPDVELSKR